VAVLRKKWTYIQKIDIHSKGKKIYISRKNSTSHRISQYNTSTMTGIQVTKHRKSTEHRKTTKHESKGKATAGN
jgi:hypothetical protein